jgi:hypothetical protein
MDSLLGLHADYDTYLFCHQCELVHTGVIRLNLFFVKEQYLPVLQYSFWLDQIGTRTNDLP